MVAVAGLADSAGIAVVAAGFAAVAGDDAAADRTAVAVKSRRKQRCFMVVYREESLSRADGAAGKKDRLNIDWKRENANGKVETRAKKA